LIPDLKIKEKGCDCICKDGYHTSGIVRNSSPSSCLEKEAGIHSFVHVGLCVVIVVLIRSVAHRIVGIKNGRLVAPVQKCPVTIEQAVQCRGRQRVTIASKSSTKS
jgi:hypothetical protein